MKGKDMNCTIRDLYTLIDTLNELVPENERDETTVNDLLERVFYLIKKFDLMVAFLNEMHK